MTLLTNNTNFTNHLSCRLDYMILKDDKYNSAGTPVVGPTPTPGLTPNFPRTAASSRCSSQADGRGSGALSELPPLPTPLPDDLGFTQPSPSPSPNGLLAANQNITIDDFAANSDFQEDLNNFDTEFSWSTSFSN